MYLPWVLVAFNAILRGGGLHELIGILIGHTYFFLAFKYPQEHGGASYLQTPQFLYDYLPNRTGGVHGFGDAQPRREQPQQQAPRRAGHNWGVGQQLGH